MIGVLACASSPPEVIGEDPARIEVVADAPIDLLRGGVPVAGRRWREDGRHHFAPAAPLRAGATYEIVAGTGRRTWTVPPAPPRGSDEVTILPAVETVPANHLRFHVRFPAPMRSPPDLFGGVALLDPAGRPIAHAFAETPLWNAERTELTLLLHPGRQKQDLPFAGSAGGVLVEGERYVLVVSGALADADGLPLGADHAHPFVAGPRDAVCPDPGRWEADLPTGLADPVRIRFDEPLDVVLLRRAFAVTGPDGPVAARAEPAPDGRSLVLFPDPAWPEGPLVLDRVGRVEDLAGNTPEGPFERAPGAPPTPAGAPFVVHFGRE